MRWAITSMTRALRWFGYGWLALGVLLEIIGLGSILVQKGFWEVAAILSPFNVKQWIMTLILLAPGMLALAWANKRTSRSSAPLP